MRDIISWMCFGIASLVVSAVGYLHAKTEWERGYTAAQIIEDVGHTEYKDVRYEVAAILVLETGNFKKLSDADVKRVTDERIDYLRTFNFPTDKKGFMKAFTKVPGLDKPYAEDVEYTNKIRQIARRLKKW